MSGPTKWSFQANFPSGDIPEQHIKRLTVPNTENQITTCFIDSFEELATRLGQILQNSQDCTFSPDQCGSATLKFFVGKRDDSMPLGLIHTTEMIPIDSWILTGLRPISINLGDLGEDGVFEVEWQYESCIHEKNSIFKTGRKIMTKYELTLEDQQDMDDYFIERKMILCDLEGYIASKKESIKANCAKAKQKPIGIVDFDFNHTIGDTIKEKYESLVLDCVNIGRKLKIYDSNKMCDVFWICGSPEITCIFEVNCDFNPIEYEHQNSLNYVGHIRILNNIWHILKNNSTIEPSGYAKDKNVEVDRSRFYIGCGDKCVLAKSHNFIL